MAQEEIDQITKELNTFFSQNEQFYKDFNSRGDINFIDKNKQAADLYDTTANMSKYISNRILVERKQSKIKFMLEQKEKEQREESQYQLEKWDRYRI